MPKRTTKQTELAGIEAPNHPELDTLLEEHDAQTSALGAGRQRIGEINEQLEEKARELKLKTYRHPTAVPALILTISTGKTKVKVAKAKATTAVDEASE